MVDKVISKIKNSYSIETAEIYCSNSIRIESKPKDIFSLLEFIRYLDIGEFDTLCGISKNADKKTINYILFSHELKVFLTVSASTESNIYKGVSVFWKNATVFEENLGIDLW